MFRRRAPRSIVISDLAIGDRDYPGAATAADR
jgi:hypothetical protein